MIDNDDNDDTLTISADKPLRLSADAMRKLEKATGRSMSELNERRGLTRERTPVTGCRGSSATVPPRRKRARSPTSDSAELWEQAGAIDIDFEAPEGMDPLGAASLTTSPPSVGSGE